MSDCSIDFSWDGDANDIIIVDGDYKEYINNNAADAIEEYEQETELPGSGTVYECESDQEDEDVSNSFRECDRSEEPRIHSWESKDEDKEPNEVGQTDEHGQ